MAVTLRSDQMELVRRLSAFFGEFASDVLPEANADGVEILYSEDHPGKVHFRFITPDGCDIGITVPEIDEMDRQAMEDLFDDLVERLGDYRSQRSTH